MKERQKNGGIRVPKTWKKIWDLEFSDNYIKVQF